ncbi:hypothetical protein ACX0GZ_04615 [Sphingomonas aestuarii]
MTDVKVNSVQPSAVSKEMVALYLLAQVSEAQGARVNVRDGVPYIEGGMTKKQILLNYIDCLYAVRNVGECHNYIKNLPD